MYGNEFTYKNSTGFDGVSIINGKYFTLFYDNISKKYCAGTCDASYNKFLEYYENNKNGFDDAELFIETIKSHHNLESKCVV